jgi:hypothetical protein
LDRWARRNINDSPSCLLQNIGSQRIRFTLESVMLAVDLDNQLASHAGKVRKVRTNRMLSPEFQSAHAMSTQKFPYFLLRETIGQAKVSLARGPLWTATHLS